MSKNNENKLVPKLRFPEFEWTSKWVVSSVEDECFVKGRIGYRGYTTDDLVSQEEGALVLGGKHIQKQILDLSDPTYLSWEKYYESPEIMIEIGDIIFSQRGTLGDCAIIENEIGPATINPSMVLLKNITCIPKFLYYVLIGDYIQNEVKKSKGLGAIPMLSQKQIREFSFLKPDNPNEQQKIAACLSSLDEVIKAESQKLEVLKDHKKGLLQNLLPQAGETTPRFRFKEFENDLEWKPRLIDEFIEERSTIAENTIPLYSLTIEDGITPKTERYERSFLVTDEENAYKVVMNGDFAYNPMNLRFGAIARYSGENSVAVSKYYNIFFCDNSVDSAFCSFYFKTTQMIKIYDDIATGTLIEKRRVHFSSFLKLKVLMPSKKEQEKIADTLSSVDDLIIAQNQKMEALQSHKKGLLQGLFPNVNEVTE